MKLYHNNSTIKTLEEFAKQNKIFLGGDESKTGKKPLTIESFFELNRVEIFNQMTVSQKIEYIKENGFMSETETDEETGEPLQLKVWELTPDHLSPDMTLPCPCYLYIDIRYYYNDKIVSIEETKPKILLDKKEYKIYGNKNNETLSQQFNDKNA